MNGNGTIQFHYLSQTTFFRDRKKTKAYIHTIFEREGFVIDSVNFIFCSDDYLLEINSHYLKHDTYTDIITFQLSQPADAILSDIYISVDRVKENAAIHSQSIAQEFHRVLFHGVLHLCGYKDKTVPQIKIIRGKEDLYLTRFFVSRET